MLKIFDAPDTILETSLCTDSNYRLQLFEHLSPTESLYSNKGQTYAVYNFSRASLPILNLSSPIRFNLL